MSGIGAIGLIAIGMIVGIVGADVPRAPKATDMVAQCRIDHDDPVSMTDAIPPDARGAIARYVCRDTGGVLMLAQVTCDVDGRRVTGRSIYCRDAAATTSIVGTGDVVIRRD